MAFTKPFDFCDFLGFSWYEMLQNFKLKDILGILTTKFEFSRQNWKVEFFSDNFQFLLSLVSDLSVK